VGRVIIYQGGSMIELLNIDCMEYMATQPDNAFPLAIVDPEYGIGMDGGNVGYKGFNNFEKKAGIQSRPLINILKNFSG
jgi:site-specific DNA-methyltransferase (adenine-specific)